MSEINVKKCDKCGDEARSDTQEHKYKEGFETINFRFGSSYSERHYNSNHFSLSCSGMLLCENCLKKFGIHRKEKDDPKIVLQNNAEKLYDLIVEIMQDNCERGG